MPAKTISVGNRPLSHWIKILEGDDPDFLAELRRIYGGDKNLIAERIAAFRRIIGHFKKVFGQDAEVSIVRVPGRLNTLGMHADHRGSFINPIAIQKETLLCYKGNDDDVVEVHNTDTSYPPRTFRISAEEPQSELQGVGEWLAVTQVLADGRVSAGTNNDWVNKVKAVPVYLQRMVFSDRKLRGFKGVFGGDIPPRIGLSSSSSIVVAVMEAMLRINDLPIRDEDYAYHCGVAEWFVGTRGGFGDHAAIRFGRSGMITHMRTTPQLVIGGFVPFPEGYSIIVFHSGIEADKTGQAGRKFNEKTATYEIGEIFIRKYILENHRVIFEKIVSSRETLGEDVKKFHLADIVENLQKEEIYSLLLSLPKKAPRRKLLELLPDEKEELESQFSTHPEPLDGYHIRAVCTYGLAECRRGRILADVLGRGDICQFGTLMNISHDGDRVSNMSERLRALKDDPDVSLELHMQPGDYNCSIEEIDRMVDICLANGAIGAQISGAGCGGSMMALIEKDKKEHLIRAMRIHYYEPSGIEERYLEVFPISGAGHL